MTDDDLILSAPPPEHWDPVLAQALIGKILLVGLTYLDPSGEVDAQEQFYGVVIDASPDDGILLDLLGPHDGDTYSLPPQTSNIAAAAPGTYAVAGTDEEVDNPDYLSNWTIAADPANDD
ncbi:MAG: hypothetical protein JWP92_332 [Caulobacter sp.]|nr:hypothetical protein [Caulobacter sp.]